MLKRWHWAIVKLSIDLSVQTLTLSLGTSGKHVEVVLSLITAADLWKIPKINYTNNYRLKIAFLHETTGSGSSRSSNFWSNDFFVFYQKLLSKLQYRVTRINSGRECEISKWQSKAKVQYLHVYLHHSLSQLFVPVKLLDFVSSSQASFSFRWHLLQAVPRCVEILVSKNEKV